MLDLDDRVREGNTAAHGPQAELDGRAPTGGGRALVARGLPAGVLRRGEQAPQLVLEAHAAHMAALLLDLPRFLGDGVEHVVVVLQLADIRKALPEDLVVGRYRRALPSGPGRGGARRRRPGPCR